ncbi:hypothetical protein GOP47_0003308 [Adiantum capillus-veneris]|uniref:Uncharacterized protein n=1 Tax=Adiantum capillus-veneris TaxID=13818 RepID=A0A9D4VBQ6_ADICA|nr:hypothetical protein GOP47_0003308 [Adiantum capillus-veneris]
MTIGLKVESHGLNTLLTQLSDCSYVDVAHATHENDYTYTSLTDLMSTNVRTSADAKKPQALKIELKDELLNCAAHAYLRPNLLETKDPQFHFRKDWFRSFVEHQGMAAIIINEVVSWTDVCRSLLTVRPYRTLVLACSRALRFFKHKTRGVSQRSDSIRRLSVHRC